MNALSFPTWMVHLSSVIEWILAIVLVCRYGDLTREPAWNGFAWAMLPALVSAMCACTWHFFDNDPALAWLVTLQAATTLVGNTTLCWASWRLGRRKEEQI